MTLHKQKVKGVYGIYKSVLVCLFVCFLKVKGEIVDAISSSIVAV